MQRVVFAVLALSLFVLGAFGSSHSEAPNSADQPVSDWTDLYAFRSYEAGREDYVTILANLYGLQAPFGGPNYFTISDQFFYEIYFDNDGDCVEDFSFRFTFGASMGGEVITYDVEPSDRDCNATGPTSQTIPGGVTLNINGTDVPVPLKNLGTVNTIADVNSTLNWFEYYSVDYVEGVRDSGSTAALHNNDDDSTVFFKPFDYAGTKTFPDYESYANNFIYTIDLDGTGSGNDFGCASDGKLFVGQRADPFYITLGKIFDLLNLVPIPGFDGAIEDDSINNDLANRNVHTIAMELPYACFFNNTVGIWLGTRRLFHDSLDNHIPGGQVNRLGNPLVNELVIGLPDKARFSHSHPSGDATDPAFGTYVGYPTLPEIISNTYLSAVNDAKKANLKSLAPQNFPRNDLITAFLTGVPGLNVVGTGGGVCDYLRLNPQIAPKSRADQDNMGVINGDAAGFPNGRRPGDDLVDIALRVVMGRLCHLNLTCTATDAPVGDVDFIDGSPVSAADFGTTFPYINTPYPGATDDEPAVCPDGGASSVISSTLIELVNYLLF